MPIAKRNFGTADSKLKPGVFTSPATDTSSSTIKDGLSADSPTTRPPKITGSIVTSAKSVDAYHATLFRSFALSPIPTYNFYVDGEDVPPTFDVSGSLAGLPRYVTLRWRTAPPATPRVPPRKGVRTSTDPMRGPLQFPTVSLEVASNALANGYISPGTISGLLVDPPAPVMTSPTSIDEDSFLLSPSAAGRSAADAVGDKNSEFSVAMPTLTKPASVVKFVDPSIAGAFEKTRLDVATDSLHLTVAGSLAKILGALEVLSEFNQDVPVQNPPPDFAGSPDAPPVLYVGYVIERWDIGLDGSMHLGRRVLIDDPGQDEFVDQRVAYGTDYAYRIRSIVQWTRTSDVDFGGISTIDRPTAFSSLISPPLASYFAGDWSDWGRTRVVDDVPPEPPDEVTVRPVSWKGQVEVSWRVGSDPQRDLSSFRLLRARSVGGKLSDWVDLGTFPIANGRYVDRDVRPYEEGNVSFVYSLYSTSYHGVDSLLSDQAEARLSPLGTREELPVIQVAVKGQDRTVHPSGRIASGPTEIKANQRLTFYCRSATSGHPLRDSTYLVEVRSLSTGERGLVRLDVDATDTGVADA